nr:immunoglobulin light chain junction region [Macaca mulatta]
CQQESSWPRTF